MDDEFAFLEHYEGWWDIGCDACGMSDGPCMCQEDWNQKFDGEDSKPKWWGWLIAPDLTCRYCSYKMSTYDGCCRKGDSYLRYRYAKAFFPEWEDAIQETLDAIRS